MIDPALVTALGEAITTLDSEEHRYVERYTACPNGCQYDNADPPHRTAGPADCDQQCFYGTVEDEDAHHIDGWIDQLRRLHTTLDTSVAENAHLRRMIDWLANEGSSYLENSGGIIMPDELVAQADAATKGA